MQFNTFGFKEMAELDGKASAPLFGVAATNQSIGSVTPSAVTGLTLTVEVGIYDAVLRIASDAGSDDNGLIETAGTAVFTSDLTAESKEAAGIIQNKSRPATFTTTGLAPSEGIGSGEILIIDGKIKVTTAGTIIINGAAQNGGGTFFIVKALSSFTLTKLN